MKLASAGLLGMLFFSVMHVQGQYLVIGTYTNNSTSKGIYIYDFDPDTFKPVELSHVEITDPSYLAVSKIGKYVYSVSETGDGKLLAFEFDKTAKKLNLLNTETSNGNAPCYISIDKTGKWLFSGNYESGNLSVHPIKNDGTIGTTRQAIQHTGNSINQQRQEAPHVHCTYVAPDNKFLYVPDLGIDKVMIYPFNAATGLLDTSKRSWIAIDAGGGPRHIIFSKNGKYGYIIEELSGTIDVVAMSGAKHKVIQQVNHLPKGEKGAAADIHLSPDEKFLYASHRSNNTIQIYKVDPKKGTLRYVAEQSTSGITPRNFTIHPSGNYLLSANQSSNEIVIFLRNSKTGLLKDTGERIRVGKPVCLQWLPE